MCSLFITLLHSERPKLYGVLAFLSAIGLKELLKIFNEKKGKFSKISLTKLSLFFAALKLEMLQVLVTKGRSGQGSDFNSTAMAYKVWLLLLHCCFMSTVNI